MHQKASLLLVYFHDLGLILVSILIRENKPSAIEKKKRERKKK
jgi:hypothetical protein